MLFPPSNLIYVCMLVSAGEMGGCSMLSQAQGGATVAGPTSPASSYLHQSPSPGITFAASFPNSPSQQSTWCTPKLASSSFPNSPSHQPVLPSVTSSVPGSPLRGVPSPSTMATFRQVFNSVTSRLQCSVPPSGNSIVIEGAKGITRGQSSPDACRSPASQSPKLKKAALMSHDDTANTSFQFSFRRTDKASASSQTDAGRNMKTSSMATQTQTGADTVGGATTLSTQTQTIQPDSSTEADRATQTTDGTQPQLTTDSTQLQLTSDSSQPHLHTDSSQAQLTTDSSQAQLTTDSTQLQLTSDSSQPQLTTNSSQPQLTSDSSQPQLTTDSSQPQLTTDNTQPQLTMDSSQPQLTTDSSRAQLTTDRAASSQVNDPVNEVQSLWSKLTLEDPNNTTTFQLVQPATGFNFSSEPSTASQPNSAPTSFNFTGMTSQAHSSTSPSLFVFGNHTNGKITSGAIYQKPEGSTSQTPEGSTSQTPEGSTSQRPEGSTSLSDKAVEAASQVFNIQTARKKVCHAQQPTVLSYYFDLTKSADGQSDSTKNTISSSQMITSKKDVSSRSSSNSPDIGHGSRISHRIAAAFSGSNSISGPEGATCHDESVQAAFHGQRIDGASGGQGQIAGATGRDVVSDGGARRMFNLGQQPSFSMGIRPNEIKKTTPPAAKRSIKKICRRK